MPFKYQSIPFINTLTLNQVSSFEDFHLSYDPHRGFYGVDTTALVLRNHVFFVLKGDHRKEMESYEEKGGFQTCFDYFLNNIDQAHEYSEHKIVIEGSSAFPSIQSVAEEYLGTENISRLREAYEAVT